MGPTMLAVWAGLPDGDAFDCFPLRCPADQVNETRLLKSSREATATMRLIMPAKSGMTRDASFERVPARTSSRIRTMIL